MGRWKSRKVGGVKAADVACISLACGHNYNDHSWLLAFMPSTYLVAQLLTSLTRCGGRVGVDEQAPHC